MVLRKSDDVFGEGISKKICSQAGNILIGVAGVMIRYSRELDSHIFFYF